MKHQGAFLDFFLIFSQMMSYLVSTGAVFSIGLVYFGFSGTSNNNNKKKIIMQKIFNHVPNTAVVGMSQHQESPSV